MYVLSSPLWSFVIICHHFLPFSSLSLVDFRSGRNKGLAVSCVCSLPHSIPQRLQEKYSLLADSISMHLFALDRESVWTTSNFIVELVQHAYRNWLFGLRGFARVRIRFSIRWVLRESSLLQTGWTPRISTAYPHAVVSSSWHAHLIHPFARVVGLLVDAPLAMLSWFVSHSFVDR